MVGADSKKKPRKNSRAEAENIRKYSDSGMKYFEYMPNGSSTDSPARTASCLPRSPSSRATWHTASRPSDQKTTLKNCAAR